MEMAKKAPQEMKAAVKAKDKGKDRKNEQKSLKPASAAKGKPTGKSAPVPRDPWKVIVHPHLAEKSMNMIEFDNKLTFIVRREANKKEIKEAIETLFGVKVLRVRTEITTAGVKKAYATLSKDTPAGEIASRLGMV
jgi:large subunit ribosomal protein L23